MDRTDKPSRRWFNRVPHPRAPAARIFEWFSVDIPHPDSPAARYLDWVSHGISHPESPSSRKDLWQPKRNRAANSADANPPDEQVIQSCQALEVSLKEHSGKFRDGLPDNSLRQIYDRHAGLLLEAQTSGESLKVATSAQILQSATRQIDWVYCHVSRVLPKGYESSIRSVLQDFHSLRARISDRDQGKLIEAIQRLSERFYQEAIRRIQEHLAQPKKPGELQELILKWRTQMIACGSSGRPGSAEAATEEPPAPSKGPSKESHWVGIQLIDEDGDPVPNAKFKVTLPDGSIKKGSLDDQGMARFDGIDPGQCQISFPEIDAKEWN